MDKLKEFAQKNRSFLVWAGGVLLYFLMSSDCKGSRFVEEHNIVTWDAINNLILAIVIIFTCRFMSAKSEPLFWNKEQNDWAKKISAKVDAIEELLR